jgi:hypothetical protein
VKRSEYEEFGRLLISVKGKCRLSQNQEEQRKGSEKVKETMIM